jgi:hypothetical protein
MHALIFRKMRSAADAGCMVIIEHAFDESMNSEK